MKDEIAAAVVFLTRIVKRNTSLTAEQMSKFSEKLALTLIEKFRNHWYEDKPSKGQAYRCIRVSRNEPRDSVISKTAKDCGIHYNHLNLPAELCLWVDPLEVSCRFGERGTVCEVATFNQQTLTDNRPSTPISSSNNAFNDNNANQLSPTPSPPSSPPRQLVINDNLRPNSGRKMVNSSQYVFNRNATNTPRVIQRPQNKVWVRQPNPEQYRWVNKSIAGRA
ncbi:maternal B9.15 protein-like [Strongylocentrotus purpuratus]|uniref:Anti-proliferative protein domain-containing protein n=1 Tax=Strongylocentrotus purpuratus TaxID=7668 RepID=A0A7M7NCK0_STRPU|nr:maternal B9.15 protein-like [Strongylocentrotus purpuratus]|eukprot:XP_792782.1 PREDICTED: maternal B9.15 protein-like [Strongylocentrotus purpuratus]